MYMLESQYSVFANNCFLTPFVVVRLLAQRLHLPFQTPVFQKQRIWLTLYS